MASNKNILITGGAGFIGSHLVKRLLGDGYSVVVLTREGTDLRRIKNFLHLLAQDNENKPSLVILRDDLSNLERLKKKLQEINPYGIFHLAASNIKSGVSAPEDDLININFAGTVRLLRALEGIDYKFFINCGSYLEYGIHASPLKESDSCEPIEIYALTKLAAGLYGQAIARSAGLPIITFRIFSPYGPDMEIGRLFYEVVKRARLGEEIKLTKPETTRDFIFIDDIVDLFVEAMDKAIDFKGEIFNLGYGQARTLENLVDQTLKFTGSKSLVTWGGAKDVAYDQGCQEANMEKTFAAFKWRPRHDLDAGIERMINWFESQKTS